MYRDTFHWAKSLAKSLKALYQSYIWLKKNINSAVGFKSSYIWEFCTQQGREKVVCSLWEKHATSQLQNVFFLLNDVLNSVLQPPLNNEAEKNIYNKGYTQV